MCLYIFSLRGFKVEVLPPLFTLLACPEEFRKSSGSDLKTLSESIFEFPSTTRLETLKPLKTKEPLLPERFQNFAALHSGKPFEFLAGGPIASGCPAEIGR